MQPLLGTTSALPAAASTSKDPLDPGALRTVGVGTERDSTGQVPLVHSVSSSPSVPTAATPVGPILALVLAVTGGPPRNGSRPLTVVEALRPWATPVEGRSGAAREARCRLPTFRVSRPCLTLPS